MTKLQSPHRPGLQLPLPEEQSKKTIINRYSIYSTISQSFRDEGCSETQDI